LLSKRFGKPLFTAEGEFFSHNGRLSILFLQKHLAPVSRARQGARQLTLHVCRPQTFANCFRISAGLVQPEESRA
jgi:hypothetical protein